ncbi:MAG: polymer-forming cytoskeletal protein [Candidatus Methylomirabilales bacterium]
MTFVIGKGLAIRGELSGVGDVHLGGEVEGKVRLTGTLVVLEGARVEADITATEIFVAGTVRGNLMALGKVELSPTGHLVGSVRSKVLVVREGGRVKGRTIVGAQSFPTEELAEIEEQVRQEEARELWRGR